MKVKSSEVLQEALARIIDGRCRYACAAIQDVETDMRYANGNKDVRCNALKIFSTLRPPEVKLINSTIREWWPVRDPLRIVALEKAIAIAKKSND